MLTSFTLATCQPGLVARRSQLASGECRPQTTIRIYAPKAETLLYRLVEESE
ncbi:hypothetical protein KIH39_23195 [Telmatocola sphagniphila]|uniref:Uncharacterized protein n=1 Tax=Telmatocola sphagniphila TaxID=1123043 RepID=A0A8E6B799_9BACT|nr:hypothetical protein [Telmatocola sphagniphila]QVL31715.1 hypothetical protein KIH39_23195 [Telmatocola sphagniphila]